MKLPLGSIKVDPTIQLRDGLDMDRVRAMQEFEEQGGHLPPITVVGDNNLLADGHHRLEALTAMGRVEIDANRVPGKKPEAIAIAIQLNDLATTLPLTRAQRNEGIKQLLSAGWTQRRIASVTGIHQTTVMNIHQGMAVKAKLPEDINIGDTIAYRIATVAEDEQVELATAVAEAELSEPRVREAIKLMDEGMTAAEAVEEVTPSKRTVPVTMSDVASQAYKRLDKFLNATMIVEGQPLDFWQVLDVLADNHDMVLPPAMNTLVDRLTEVSSKTDQYASRLRNGVLKEITA